MNDNMMFTEYLNLWLELVRPSVMTTTHAGYRGCVKIVTEYFTPLGLRLSEVKPLHLQKFYAEIQKIRKIKAVTVIHYHANIHKALKEAVRLDFISTNPADKVILPKKETFEGQYYTVSEVGELFKAFEGDECELCIYLAVYYGLRRSEIIGLKWEAIDFGEMKIEIRNKITEALDENGNYIIVEETALKNKSSRRSFPLIPEIANRLTAEREKQEKRKQLLGDCYDKSYDGYVCRKSNGKLIKPNYLSDHFDWIVKKRGLRVIRLHDLRHTCASLMLQNGLDMKNIQVWLGHSNYNTTANIYSHLDFKAKRHSAEVIGSLIGGINKLTPKTL